MALDPAIPLSVKGFQLQSPVEQAGGILGLLNAMSQQKLRDMQMQQLLDERRRDTALREGLANAGTDPQAMFAAALQAGDVKTALAIRKQMQEAETATANTNLAKARTGEIQGRQDAITQLQAMLNPQTYATPGAPAANTQVFGPGTVAPPTTVQAQIGRPPAEQAAIASLLGKPEGYQAIVPNQAGIEGLRARIDPRSFVTQSMRPPPRPQQQVVPVTGGYLEVQPDGTRKFVRTQETQPRPEPAPTTRIVQDPNSPTGWSHRDMRSGELTPGAPPPAASTRTQEREETRGALADYADALVTRLETTLKNDPRSATGLFSGVIRGTEAVINSAAPGAIGSQATIAKQTKEQLLSVLGQIRGGGAGRLSNQDMRRVDTAIGQLNSGTPEGMAQGLKDARTLINAMRGGPAPDSTPPPPPSGEQDYSKLWK